MPPINYDNTPIYTYATTTTDAYTTINTDRINRPITFDTITYDADDVATTYTPLNVPRMVTMNDMENWFKKIYKIISEHTHIDISEEEFLNILAEK